LDEMLEELEDKPTKKGKEVPSKKSDLKPSVKLHGKWDRENDAGPSTSAMHRGNNHGASTSAGDHHFPDDRKRNQRSGRKEAREVPPDHTVLQAL
jgi:hypothetical protein